MSITKIIGAVGRSYLERVKTEVHLLQVITRYPDLVVARPSYWRFDRLSAIEVRGRATVGSYCEIIVFERSPRSRVPGRLILHDGALVQAGSFVRAAGGTIEIGPLSGIAQGCVVIAANHTLPEGRPFVSAPWDETRTGVVLGRNVWVGAHSTLLPGVTIGDDAVVAAGSVVTKPVPAGQIWGGVPARFIKNVR